MTDTIHTLKLLIAVRKLIGIHDPCKVVLTHKLGTCEYEVRYEGKKVGTIPVV